MIRLLILLGILALIFFVVVVSVDFYVRMEDREINLSYQKPKVENLSVKAELEKVNVSI